MLYTSQAIAVVALAGCFMVPLAAAQSQSDLNRKAGSRLSQTTEELAKVVTSYRQRLNTEQRALFDRSHEQWEKYRDAACQFEASGTKGGTAQPMVRSECLATQSSERLRYMRRLSNCKEGDLSCPAWKPASNPAFESGPPPAAAQRER